LNDPYTAGWGIRLSQESLACRDLTKPPDDVSCYHNGPLYQVKLKHIGH